MDDLDIHKFYLIDKIIRSQTQWDKYKTYYLGDILPRIVRDNIPHKSVWANISALKDIVSELRDILTTSEMYQLPQMVEKLLLGGSQAEISSHPKFLELIKQEQELLARANNKQALIDRIESILKSDFLAADEYLKNDPDRELLSDTEYQKQKAEFTQKWAKREKLPSPDIDLDEEQAAAVAAYGKDIQIIARAGSGKTGTLVTRTLFP